ncbi:MAG: hypothetical protein QNK04_20300 [Myxococcota bacterium]|nr:hypothetical protein [Myxococcota bacterium]
MIRNVASPVGLLVAALWLVACQTVPAATKKNWEWVGAGDEPTVFSLIDARETCRGISKDETAIEGCMARAGWVRRR